MKLVAVQCPGWTLLTGSSHLALPVLSAVLAVQGHDVFCLDLNLTLARALVHLPSEAPPRAGWDGFYFDLEGPLSSFARQYGISWDLDRGAIYPDELANSSRFAMQPGERGTVYRDFLQESAVPAILEATPEVVAVSLVSSHQIAASFELARLLRQSGFQGHIVFGGNTISRLRKEMMIPEVFELIDSFVVFEGEGPLVALCEALDTGTSLASVPNLTWRDGDTIRENPVALSATPDFWPTPDFSGLPVGEYWGENYLTMIGARGCYYGKCTFCAIPFGWGHGGFSGVRSARKVYEDMVTLYERHGINRFKFVDESLLVPMMRELSEMILADGAKFEWEGYTRLEKAFGDPEFVELVSAAGFKKGYFGVEILSSRLALNKKDVLDPYTVFKTCHDAGIKGHCFCMFGYPGTHREDAEATVRFLLENKDIVDTADMVPWTYAKHTHTAGVEPIIDPDQDWALEYPHRATRDGVMSSEESAALVEELQELVWDEEPRMLHPTYRMFSPWSTGLAKLEAAEAASVAADSR